jgi:hypothetical protein
MPLLMRRFHQPAPPTISIIRSEGLDGIGVAAAAFGKRDYAQLANAIHLPAASASDKPEGSFSVNNRQVRPREPVQGRVNSEPCAGTLAPRVLTSQVPLAQEVVCVLGHVGDINDVFPNFLAGLGN